MMSVLSAFLALTAVATPTGDLPPELEAMAEQMRLPIDGPPAPFPSQGAFIDVGRGPVPVFIPSSYDPKVATPLMIALHGYTASGAELEAWMQLSLVAESEGLLYLAPDGTTDCFGQSFWNATDACCNFCGSSVDDSGYLRAIIDEMKAQYNVDERRVYFVGHSNGGFMSYRMACDHADVVAAIASLAGATYLDPVDCTPSEAVHTLQMHGTSDTVIDYAGGCILFGGCYPSAPQTTAYWAEYDGCAPVDEPGDGPYDLTSDVAGPETTTRRYVQDCDPSGSARLWTINGGGHSPNLTDDFRRLVVDFLLAHPKPAACPADIDGNGTVDTADLLALLAAWGPCGKCPEDVDGTGTVDTADLLELLAAWGPCG
jgi:polyhydroxybutyrate depolymerase